MSCGKIANLKCGGSAQDWCVQLLEEMRIQSHRWLWESGEKLIHGFLPNKELKTKKIEM